MRRFAAASSLMAKLWALRALWRMFRYLENWRDVWAAYRTQQTLPALQFRRGFTLNHGPADDPIMLLHTVFARSEYGALTTGRLIPEWRATGPAPQPSRTRGRWRAPVRPR